MKECEGGGGGVQALLITQHTGVVTLRRCLRLVEGY